MASPRHLVPALGLFALVPALLAEEVAKPADAPKSPVVTFSGWADNIFSVSDDNLEQVGGPTAKSTQAPIARFTSTANLKAGWKIGDQLSGKINAWFYPVASDGTSAKQSLNLREAYALYQVSEAVGLKMGKYIDHIDWIAQDPTGLYLVNGSIIGYTGNTYGNDVLGAAVIITPKDSPISGELHVTNGYYTSTDAYSYNYDVTATNPNRANSDMGWGFDLTYTLPKDMGNVNLEGAYDTHSAYNAMNADALGGKVSYVGINLTLKPIKDLIVGLEVQAKEIGLGATSDGGDFGGKEKIYQGMILANYALSGTPFPMSITLSDQYIVALNDEKFDATNASMADQGKNRVNAVQAALLTNPTGSTNFGLNLEVGYYQRLFGETASTPADGMRGWETALEALISF